jgi:hypothetical protein
MKRSTRKPAKSKPSRAKRAPKTAKPKTARRKAAPRKAASAKRPAAAKKAPRKTVRKKAAARKTSAKRPARKTSSRSPRSRSSREPVEPGARRAPRSFSPPQPRFGGLGADSGGQSGDTEGLQGFAGADSQSVLELLEEGQSFEAGIISGVEGARNADEGEVTTREVAEDDVPLEYLDQ